MIDIKDKLVSLELLKSYHDIIKYLANLTDDDTHRTVTDEQIKAWSNKSEFSGKWEDLEDKPIATVDQSKQYLSIQ